MKTAKMLLTLALVCVVSASVMAADEKKPARKKGAPTPVAVQLPKEIELTDAQKEKLAAVNKEYAEKFAAAQKAVDAVLTDEQKKARHDVMKEARTSGKKGKELQQTIKDATKATDEQQKKIEVAEKALTELRHEILEKVKPILTDEQKAKLPQRKGAGKKKAKEKKAA